MGVSLGVAVTPETPVEKPASEDHIAPEDLAPVTLSR